MKNSKFADKILRFQILIHIRCSRSETAWSLDNESWKIAFHTTSGGKEYTLSVANAQEVNCEGVLLWGEELKKCGEY